MGINLRKVKIINNTGAVNVGDCYDISPLAVAKVYVLYEAAQPSVFTINAENT
ncbi:spore germination protein [Bacillus cereus]